MKISFKKLLVSLSVVVTWFFCFFPMVTFSQATDISTKTSTTSQNEQKTAKSLQMYQNLGEWMYAITWPLILIAWKFMDNDVIYGSFIGLDVLLWKIWNVMRTFANYIIWLILIFSIFTLFLGWKFEQFNPIKIIPQLVIAALLVNASWFILWACLDFSTFLTYSIWNLPLKIWWENLQIKNQKIPTFAIQFQNDKKVIKVWIKNWKDILPFCEMTALAWWNGGVKVFPKNPKNWSCVYACGTSYYIVSGKWVEIPQWKEIDCKKYFSQEIWWKTFWQLMKQNPGMTTILWTLYASIINIWRLSVASTGTTAWMTTDLLFRFLFLFALIIPLFTFALIMIVRAVVLWMFIVISPIIFLFTSVKWIWDKLLWEKWTLKELCCLVFLPVTVTFALSISFVFLSILNFKTLKTNFWIEWKWNEVYIETDWNPDHRIVIRYKDTGKDSAMTNLFGFFQNTILWIIKLMFAIGFMWVLVFTALKSCKVTQGIATFIGNFAKEMAKAAPVLPWWQSLASVSQGLSRLKTLPQDKQVKQREHLENLFKEFTGKEAEQKVIKELSNKLTTVKTDVDKKISDSFSKQVTYIPKWAKKAITTSETLENITYDKLAKDQKLKEKVASVLGLDTSFIDDLIKKHSPTDKLSVAKSEIEQAVEDAKVKKILDDALNKKITIVALSDKAKEELVEVLNRHLKHVSPPLTLVDIKEKSERLAQALKDFGLNKDDIKKLIVKNLVWDEIEESDKKVVERIVNNLK